MDRLICGDVAFGKTEVALRAMFKTVLNNEQVLYLCPTTILSKQQYNVALERFKNWPVEIALLNRHVPAGKAKKILQDLKDGKIDIFCTVGNRFKFCNAFSATHSHDTLYFLLNAFTQLGMKSSRDEVVLLGSVPHQQWIADHLKKYVERIVVEPLPDSKLPLDLSLLTNLPQP